MTSRWSIESLDTVTSTMDVARHRAWGGAPDGLIIVAAEQTAGRGRRGSRWESPRGGLWFSTILDTAGRPVPALTIAGALACAAACESVSGVDVRVKWPNDLFAGEAKLGGVMGESIPGGVILGIGINADLPAAALPAARHYATTSLRVMSGRAIDRQELLKATLVALGSRCDAVMQGGLAALMPEWRRRSLELGRRVEVLRESGRFDARAVDLLDDGGLVVEAPGGRVTLAPHGGVSVAVRSSAEEPCGPVER